MKFCCLVKVFYVSNSKHETLTQLEKFSQQTAKVKCDEFMSFNFKLLMAVKFERFCDEKFKSLSN